MIVRPKWDYCMKELFRNLWRRYKYQKQGIVDVLKMYHHQHFGFSFDMGQ